MSSSFFSRTESRSSIEHAEALLRTLMHEFFQTETSAVQHCRREAERHGSIPPAEALRAVAEHASEVVRELPAFADRANLPVSKQGVIRGALFSEMRDKVFDRLIQAERSYRGTLLGIRHGVDVALSLRAVAEVLGNELVFDFCESWLTRRTVLMERVEEELVWFARHPEQAARTAKLTLRRATHSLEDASRSQSP